MTLQVPYLADEAIERDAEALLAQFAQARGMAISSTSNSTTCTVGSGSRAVGPEPRRTSLARSGLREARSSSTKVSIPRNARRLRGAIDSPWRMKAAGTGDCTDRWFRQTAVRGHSLGMRGSQPSSVARAEPTSALSCRRIYMLRTCSCRASWFFRHGAIAWATIILLGFGERTESSMLMK